MKRKVVNAGNLRLSPNEEAFILKEDYERRRKLRLLQVREQEKDIALQIRKDVKQRRHQHFTRLAEELRAEWEESQTQKIQNLEKLYLASLRTMGEGHRQAKENEPDLNALAQQTAERKRKAELRHKEALKVQKNQKEILMKQKSWPIKARKEALLMEKERSAKITSRPLPPPALFENIEVKRISSVKTNSSTYHHISTFVNKEMVTTQPDAHLAAEEEAKRLEELQRQATQERVEQFQKAHVRGFQAMKRIHLAQNQEKLMKELKQLQQEDLARRRQTVAQMPPQLVELPYKRSEMKEDWQRELEFAFEDMYNADRKVKGNLILHLEPEPLPAVTDQIQDEELDLSMEQENTGESTNHQVKEAEMMCSSETDVPLAVNTEQLSSKIIFKKLLNRIRNQKSLWTIKSMSEDESEMITTVSEIESKSPTVESGTISSEEKLLSSEQEQVVETDTVESGLLTSEDMPPSCQTDSGKEQEISETPPVITLAQSSVLLHPQEEAVRVRMSARQKQIMEIEEQKQKQLELLEQIEQQKLRLETDCFKAKLEEGKRKKVHWTGVGAAPVSCTVISDEDNHRQMIHNYQQQLLQQNRLHRQTVETARKRLLEYQTILKGRYPSASATSLISDSIISVPPRESEKFTTLSQHWGQSHRFELRSNKYQYMQPIQISKLKQDHIQVPRLSDFPQQVERTEVLITSDVLAKQSLESQDHLKQKQSSESQEHLKQFFQTEMLQSHYKSVSKDSHTLSKALSHDRPLMLQDTGKMSATLRATNFQALDSQQISENNENISSKPTEPALFQPLVPQHSFTMLPFKVESEKIQEPFSTVNKNAVSMHHSVISQMHSQPLSSLESITAQQGHLKALQEQLELQKEVLQKRQEAQEQLLWNRQKELEEQTGLSVFLPVRAPDSVTSPPSAKTELKGIQESSPPKNATAVSSSDSVIPQLPDRLLSFSQPVLSQQSNCEFLQEQLNIQRDSLQARREAQEVLLVHKQNELDGRVFSDQAQPSSLPHQVTQHTFTSLPFGDRKPGKIQEQHLSVSEKGTLSTQSEISRSQDGSLSFLKQFRPLHDSSTLLQEQLATQREILQPRQGTQVAFSPVIAQHSDALQASAKAEPRSFQKLYLSGEENVIPSIIPTFQDKSLTFPPHSLPKQENLTTLQEQSHIQRVILGARQATQESGHSQSELEKRSASEQTGTSLSQVAESERFQECMSIKSDSTVPLSHSVIPGLQERLLRFSQQTLRLQDNLDKHQEWLNTEKKDFHFSQKFQENTSQQTGLSSFIPQLGQLSCTSLPSADSGTTQEPLSTGSDSEVPSRHIQIPELQDRLLKISQLIQPQQDNLKAIQEQLAIQREAILQSRQEALEEMFLRKHSRWKGGTAPEQMDTSSPLAAQHSFASLPPSEYERTQELCPTNSETTSSSSHSEPQRLPNGQWGLLPPVLPQQDNLIVLQEHSQVQKNSLSSIEKTQKEVVLPRQYKPEEEVSSEHFNHLHHGDLKALQQQLDTQRETIRSGQEVQEELLLQRLSKLEKRVSSEQISSSSLYPQAALPAADSERTQKSFPTKSHDTDTLSSQNRTLSFSQPSLSQQDNLTAHLDLEREMVYSNEKPQEEWILNRQSKLNKSESAENAPPVCFSSKEIENSFIPLPFAEARSESVCELYSSKTGQSPPSSDSMILRFQDRLLSGSQPVLTQQENLGFQKHLNLQRKILQYSQKAQKELLVQRQTALQQQIQKHQEILKDFFKASQASKPTVESDLEIRTMEQLREWLPHIRDLARGDHADGSNSDNTQLLSDVSAKQSGEHLDKEPGRRASKPPVARIKCGLDLNQHELSAIQEVESPASGRTSIPGITDLSQDRDPMRVSISREQSFLGNPLAHDTTGCLQQTTQEHVYGDDCGEAVKVQESHVESHAGLSYAAEEEEYTYLSATIQPDNKAETQETFHEPLSSVTLSTGSLSYENTDLSLTDAESFSENVDQREQESTIGKEEEADILSFEVPSTEVIYQQENASNVHKSVLSALEEFASGHTHTQQTIEKYKNEANLIPEKADLQVDFDFPELEHIFPNLHRQLFKPLEPHPDFDLSSSSVISQDNRNLYQNSDSFSERQCATESKSRVSFTALKRTSLDSFFNTSLNQQPNPNMDHAVGQSFATDSIIEGSEKSFQQLLPEFSSQEGSQHADLPSICSIEARDYSQGMEDQNCPSEEQTEILQNKKKSVHFKLSVGNLSSAYSSFDEPNVFGQLGIQHSTPCGSSSSECSIKHQQESRRERLAFEEPSKGEVVTVLRGQGLTEDGKHETHRVLDVNPHVEEIDSQLCVRTVEMGTSEKYFENSTKTEAPEIIRNLSQIAQPEPIINSGSFSLHSCIPVWETESGHGIMEEPELTLVSTSDISIAETDFANLMLEEEREDGAKNYIQETEFLPLAAQTEETSDNSTLSELPMQKLKESTDSSVSSLKGVNKVNFSEEKTAQAIMHQKAPRLYQLAEVKQQKEEKAKQEAYAQNRARAKEFHKKTLEKLRAKSAC